MAFLGVGWSWVVVRLLKETTERKALLTLPEEPAFTTEAAANSLRMSRQFLVNLLEKVEISR